MQPATETRLRIGRADGIETVGVREDGPVPIGRTQNQRDLSAAPKGFAATFEVC